jgi:hypothetical protein
MPRFSYPAIVFAALFPIVAIAQLTVPCTDALAATGFTATPYDDAGDVVTLTGTIRNGGLAPASVPWTVQKDGVTLQSGNVSVANFGTAAITVLWRPGDFGRHTLELIVDPAGTLHDCTDNNHARVTVTPVALASVSVMRSDVFSASPFSVTVTLTDPAPSGGTQVSIQSSSALIATQQIVVPPGSTGVAVVMQPAVTGTITGVTLTASHALVSKSVAVNVHPPQIDIIAPPNPIVLAVWVGSSGEKYYGVKIQVSLAANAPSGGIVIPLATDSPSIASVPESVTIPAGGHESAQVMVRLADVPADTAFTLNAGSGFDLKSRQFILKAVAPKEIAGIASPPIYDGSPGGGIVSEVRMNTEVLRAGGIVVHPVSSDPSLIAVADITVPQFSRAASLYLPVRTTLTQKTVTVTAGEAHADITLLPPTFVSFKLVNTTGYVVNELYGSQPLVGTLKFSQIIQTSEPLVIALMSNNPAVTVPPSITMTTWQSVSIPITTSAVQADVPVTITATTGPLTISVPITIQSMRVKSLLTPASIAAGDIPGMALEMTGPLTSAGDAVPVWTDKPALVSVSNPVIANSHMQGAFYAGVGSPDADTEVTIFAGREPHVVSSHFTVRAQMLANFTVSKTTMKAGEANATATITLRDGVPRFRSFTVTMSSDDPRIYVPPTVVIPEYNQTATIPFSAPWVTAPITVNLTASAGNVTKTIPITVQP